MISNVVTDTFGKTAPTILKKMLSKKDNLIFLNKSSEKEIIIKENEARELSKDEIVSFSNYLIFKVQTILGLFLPRRKLKFNSFRIFQNWNF